MPSKKSPKTKVISKKPASKPAKAPKSALRRVADVAKKLVPKKAAPPPKLSPKLAPKVKIISKVPVIAKAKELPAKKPTAVVEVKKTTKAVKVLEVKKAGGGKPKEVVAVEVSSTIAVKKGKSASSIPVKTPKELKKRCREPVCESDVVVAGYCRLHYIKNWRKIKRKEAILATGQLNNYVEELVSKYPDKYLDVIRQDLGSEKDWSKVVVDLELDSADDDFAGDDEDAPSSEGTGRRDRDFDDDTESF